MGRSGCRKYPVRLVRRSEGAVKDSLGILFDAFSFKKELEETFPTLPSWTITSWVAFAVERTNVSKFDVYHHFRYFSSRRLLTIGFHPRRQL